MKNLIREHLGITQEDMALLLQVSRSQLSLYEIGKRDLPVDAKLKLAAILSHIQTAIVNIDYGIKNVESATDGVQRTGVSLERIGRMPMPIDILVEYTDGTKESFYIPLRMMSFEKDNPTPAIKRTVLKDWAWGNPNYFFEIAKGKTSIKKITIDPLGLMADVKKENNSFEIK